MTQQQVEKITEDMTAENLSEYKALHEPIEANADINIKKVSTNKRKIMTPNTQLTLF